MSKELRDMFDSAPVKRPERRRGMDRRGKIGLALSLIGWSLWGVGMYLVYFAFPQLYTYFDKLYNKSPNLSWEPAYIFIAEAIWAAGSLLCVISLFQFRKRYRRRTDKRHWGILTALFFNVLSIIGFGIFSLVMGFR